MGNVWRFPYLCYKHGGGAFLIPYAIMLAFIGIPCFFLEITIGQYAAMGPVTIYSNLSPLFKGNVMRHSVWIFKHCENHWLTFFSTVAVVLCYWHLMKICILTIFFFAGLGFANFMASCFVGLYYNMIIAWTIYYLFASFTSKLPWDTCQNDFNSPCKSQFYSLKISKKHQKSIELYPHFLKKFNFPGMVLHFGGKIQTFLSLNKSGLQL